MEVMLWVSIINTMNHLSRHHTVGVPPPAEAKPVDHKQMQILYYAQKIADCVEL